MTEANLERLLVRAGMRLRRVRAVRLALAALGIGLLAAAALTLAVRMQDGPPALIWAALAALPALTLGTLLAAYALWRPQAQAVALLLDERAQTSEHLTTWLALRRPQADAPSGLRREFCALQRESTLQAAARIDLRTVLPFKLPAWTRSLGLAVLLLCCALLVPAQHAEEDSAPAAFRTGTKQTLMPTGANADGTVSEQMPHIQVISPEDVQRLLLTLTDDRISLEEKAKLLAQLNAKTANLPRSELPPALQDAMAEVEKELASRKPDVTAPAGARQTAGTGEPAPGSSAPPAAANAVEIRERAMALIQHNFSDVQEPLERYYRALAVH